MLFSCTQLDFDAPVNTKMPKSTLVKFNVNIKNVNSLLSILDKGESYKNIENIEPIIYSGDTLLYIVNYKNDNGWRLISGDRRTPNTLASDSTGSFKMNELNPGVATWLDELSERIYALKKQGVADTTGADYKFWSNIDKFLSYKERLNNPSKVAAPIEGQNYWQLVNVYAESLPSITIGPLTSTRWGQDSPWNQCVPLIRDGSKRCVAGCVALSGAQMLYYLHYHINKPVSMFSQGACYGWSDTDASSYGFSFSNSISTAWDLMATNNYDWYRNSYNSSILIGYVGSQIGMKYTEKGSSANTSDLKNLYSSLGVNSVYAGYNSSIASNSISNNMPVIVRADTKDGYVTFLGINLWAKYTGHSWIMDGIETRRTKYTYYYEWVGTGSGGGVQPIQLVSKIISPNDPLTPGTKTEEYISYSSYFIMNWGWSGSHNDGRFTYDNDWIINDTNANGDPVTYNFIYSREMLYNFN